MTIVPASAAVTAVRSCASTGRAIIAMAVMAARSLPNQAFWLGRAETAPMTGDAASGRVSSMRAKSPGLIEPLKATPRMQGAGQRTNRASCSWMQPLSCA